MALNTVSIFDNAHLIGFALDFLAKNMSADQEIAEMFAGQAMSEKDADELAIWTNQIEYITLHIATIVKSSGIDRMYVGITKEQLKHEVYDYISGWWDDDLTDAPDMPDNWDEAITYYFDHTEGFSIHYGTYMLKVRNFDTDNKEGK